MNNRCEIYRSEPEVTMHNKTELLEKFQKFRTAFDHSRPSVRYFTLFVGLFIVFYTWKICIGIDLNDRRTLKRYEILNQQLTKKVEQFEQNIEDGKLIKLDTSKIGKKSDYNSTEKVLKRINQIIRGIDEFQMQQVVVTDYENSIDGVQIKVKGGYFPLLSFVKSIIGNDLPVEISKLKYKMVNYPEANIDIYLKIKETNGIK